MGLVWTGCLSLAGSVGGREHNVHIWLLSMSHVNEGGRGSSQKRMLG